MLFITVKYAGAAYLMFLGIRRILEKDAPLAPDALLKQPSSSELPARSLVLQGFSVNALNPKTALFFLALLPQFVAPAAGPASLQILAFGGVFVALGFLTNSIYGRIDGKLGSFARRSVRFRKATRFVGGGTLVALGVAAALALGPHRPATATR
jgi:threonine/homoserine/homoserine lactone efflux protein